MRRAAVFASAARYEPFGLAVLEAAMHGARSCLPTSRRFRELWHDAALFIAADDAAGFAAAFDGLAEEPALRRRLAARAASAPAGSRWSARSGRSGRPTRGASRSRRDCGGGRRGVRLLYTHSFVSDWNHGNAHFLRGVARELQARGHDVWRWSRRTDGAARTCLRHKAARRLTASTATFPNWRPPPMTPNRTTRPPSTTPTWCSCTSGPSPP